MIVYGIGLAGTTLLLVISAFLSTAESAYFHLPKAERDELEDRKERKAILARKLLLHPRRLTMEIRLSNLTVRMAAAALLTILALHRAPAFDLPPALILAAHWIVLLVLVAGPTEVVPRAYGISNARRVALGAAPFLTVLDRVVGPVFQLFVGLFRRVAGLLRVRWVVPYLTAEDVIAVVEAGEEGGEIEEDEREMIYSILELGDTEVREVMVPRVDMVAIERKSPIREALSKITSHGHSRIPVYEERIDRIIGVVYAKDLLRRPVRDDLDSPVDGVMRPAYFVPDGKRVDDLLREFKEEKVHLAVVVDEYGGTAGLVTLEDVIEEIVGEIQDEYDREEEMFEAVGPDMALVNAKIPIDDLNERFNISIPADVHDTLGGYIFDLVDRVPSEGETFEDRESGLSFKVERVDRQRIARVRIRKSLDPEENGPGEEPAEE